MHTYKGLYKKSTENPRRRPHLVFTREKCHAPEFDCAAVTRKLVGPEVREGWRLQNWCSRQRPGGPAPVVSDIEDCMRCRSVSGAAKLFAIAGLPEPCRGRDSIIRHRTKTSFAITVASRQGLLDRGTAKCNDLLDTPLAGRQSFSQLRF